MRQLIDANGPNRQRLQAAGTLVAITLVAGLFGLAGTPAAAGAFAPGWDKVAHGVVFGLLAAALWFALGGRRPWLALFLAVAVGALDEWHQLGIAGRVGDATDLLADAIAALCVVLLLNRYASEQKAA
jgi:VanZ family protein